MIDLLKILFEEGFLSKREVDKLKKEISPEKKVEEFLIEKRIISEETLFEIKSRELKIPLKKIDLSKIPEEVFDLFPEETMISYKFIPFAKERNLLKIGMVYPEDEEAKEAIRFISRRHNFRHQIFLISLSDFQKVISKYRSLKREAEKAIKELKIKPSFPKKEKVKKLAERAPIVRLISSILSSAVEKKASDIHIEPQKEKTRVRFRIDGLLREVLSLPLSLAPSLVARLKILSNLRIDETRIPQGGRFSKEIFKKKIDFRVSTFPTMLGEKVALRVLDPETGLRNYTELGLTERNFKIIKEMLKRPHGLILAVGPTGCGKTTTLYALLRELNKLEINVVTIEDPIEYSIEGINQSQIKPEIGYDFANALREILRQDPDIIMVGEIRDEETANLAIHAGLTGHIVLSTLHTNNAIGVIPRLIDLGVRPFLIPSALNLAVAQRLVRLICPYCKKKRELKGKLKEYFLSEIFSPVGAFPEEVKKKITLKKPLVVFEGKGCSKCNFTGYLGRTGVFEILKMTPSLAKIIIEGPTEEKLIVEATRQGMITFTQDAILKVLSGITTVEEVLRIS